MNRLSARLGTALLVLLAVAASQVHAEFLNWTYTSNPNVQGIAVNATAATGGANVALTNFNTPQAGAATIPVIAYVTSTSSTTPITFGPASDVPTSYNLALTITDGSKGDSATLNFTGTLAGALTATTSSVVNTLTPSSLTEGGTTTPTTSNSFTLDGHTYTVNLPPTTLAPPTSPQQNIMANVSVTDASTGGTSPGGATPPPVQNAPEPTSLLLGSLGFSCFGLSRWWKHRSASRRQPEQPIETA